MCARNGMFAYNSIICGGDLVADGVCIDSNGIRGTISVGGGARVSVKTDGTFVIDGKEYKTDEVEVRVAYKIKSTGQTVFTSMDKLPLQIKGDHARVSVSTVTGDVDLKCDGPCTVDRIDTTGGDVRVTGDVTNIDTTGGNVTVEGSVPGSISTTGGNVRCRDRELPRRVPRRRAPLEIAAPDAVPAIKQEEVGAASDCEVIEPAGKRQRI